MPETRQHESSPHTVDVAGLVSATYVVGYTYPGSIFAEVKTYIGAYSPEDAANRVLASLSAYPEARILSVSEPLAPENPVTCTYEGGPDAAYPDGPWVFLAHVDHAAPVIVCDIHGLPAHPSVYDTGPDADPLDPERYSGPCQFHPELVSTPVNC